METGDGRQPLAPGLYVVATPIGNLGDITLRAIETLRRADAIVCEDTRVTRTLAQRFQLTAPMIAYNDHNAPHVRPGLLARMAAGQALALVSDAGTPLIADPGWRLAAEARDAGQGVTVIPGPSAAVAALVAAGLPTDRFLFAGFLPAKAAARATALAGLAPVDATLVLFETAPRLAESLAQMAAILGDRPAAVVRELTKLHEEVRRAGLAALAAHYAAAGAPRGEIVVVVGPPPEAPLDDDAVDRGLRAALADAPPGAAAARVAKATGRTRREVYARALVLARDGEEGAKRDDSGDEPA